jgi:transposase
MDTSEPTKRTRVRAYGQEFEARVLAECQQPGASVAKVALAHGLNAKKIHTWRRELRAPVARPVVALLEST